MSDDNVPTVQPAAPEPAVPAPSRRRPWGVVAAVSALVAMAVTAIALLLAAPVSAAPSPAPSPPGGSSTHSCPNM